MTTEAEATKQDEAQTVDHGPRVIKLSAPVKYEDIERSELVLDLDGLLGKDIELAFREAQIARGGQQVMSPAADKMCQAHVAAKAAGVPAGLILKLKARDFETVTTSVFIFLAI